jgi:hypothetical protein
MGSRGAGGLRGLRGYAWRTRQGFYHAFPLRFGGACVAPTVLGGFNTTVEFFMLRVCKYKP